MPTYSVVKCAVDNYNENLNGSKQDSNSNLNVKNIKYEWRDGWNRKSSSQYPGACL